MTATPRAAAHRSGPALATEPFDEPLRRRIAAAIDRLEAWGWLRGWRGSDPYEGLNARGLRVLKRTALGRRVLIQAVKRSPVDLRPALGIGAGLSAAGVGQLLSAYARHPRLDAAERRVRVDWALDSLEALRSPAFPEPCWGYHFDVETRVFGYPAASPNTVATAFAGFGLLDAYEELADERAAVHLAGVADYFMKRTGRGDDGAGAYFGYLPGDATSVHNANLLACAYLARYATATGEAGVLDAVRNGVAHTLASQRADGSWPYGERDDLAWVDNHHTGYVLDALWHCRNAGIDGLDGAYARGLEFYAEHLFDADARPRFFSNRTHPIDGLCVAQAIHTLALASREAPAHLDLGARVLDFALSRMGRPDGAFVFQRHRTWVNSAPHIRWVQAPMLDALTLMEGAADSPSAVGEGQE